MIIVTASVFLSCTRAHRWMAQVSKKVRNSCKMADSRLSLPHTYVRVHKTELAHKRLIRPQDARRRKGTTVVVVAGPNTRHAHAHVDVTQRTGNAYACACINPSAEPNCVVVFMHVCGLNARCVMWGWWFGQGVASRQVENRDMYTELGVHEKRRFLHRSKKSPRARKDQIREMHTFTLNFHSSQSVRQS